MDTNSLNTSSRVIQSRHKTHLQSRKILPRPCLGIGFTLVELLVVLAIIAIIATVAVPAFQDMIKTNAVASQNNELVALIQYARSEAVRSGASVEVAILNSETETTGWSVSIPNLRETANPRMELTSTTATLVFNNRGYLEDPDDSSIWLTQGATLNLKHVDCTRPSQHRVLTILPTGQLQGAPADDC
jgi:prepilin-type N-terminal cleavage/methylation domain-containing protein